MSSSGGSGKFVALAIGMVGSLVIAAVTAAATVAQDYQELPPPPPAAVRPKPRRRNFLSISPRGHYWWQITDADHLDLPSVLTSSTELLRIWQSLPTHESGFAHKQENVVETLVRSNRCPGVDKEQILRDIPRTFPEEEYFSDRDVQDSMERVLMCVCIEYPEVGYVQSMNFLCSFLFLHCKTEDACFGLFRELMSHPRLRMEEMYLPGLPLLFRVLSVFDHLLTKHVPRCRNKFSQEGLDLMMFSQTWFMTLFTYSMDWEVVGPVWDMFFNLGWEAPLRVALYLVKRHEEAILKEDFDGISRLLRDACGQATAELSVQCVKQFVFDAEDFRLCKEVVGGSV